VPRGKPDSRAKKEAIVRKIVAVLFSLVLVLGFVAAQEKMSAEAQKAKDMVKAGLAFYKANGRDAALAAFNDPKGKFRDGEYYLFVYDYSKDGTAVCMARGDGNAAMIGKDLWGAKDPDGKFFYQDFGKVAKASGSSWVDYKRTNPDTKKIENKSSYIERIPDTTLLVGCGFYKN